MKKELNLSCEFFPPKTEEGLNKIIAAAYELTEIAPIAPHLICIGSTKENINALIKLNKNEDCHYIVVLRGDLLKGVTDPGVFRSALLSAPKENQK